MVTAQFDGRGFTLSEHAVSSIEKTIDKYTVEASQKSF